MTASSAGPKDGSFELRVIQRVREIPRDAWDRLVGDGDASSPFVEWTWLDA
ncbi:MAG: hypothetical protein JOZ69_23015, partial [Myxococcales bacterium]|nr:hypothetical protein [Myxococcales bacterium]